MRKILFLGAMASLFAACKPNVAITTKPSPGLATFKNYLAIGNSFTAGFGDNQLTVSGQINSYPQRLFEQFSLVGADGPFVQPRLHSDIGFLGPKLIMGYVAHCNSEVTLGPVDYPNWAADAEDNQYVSTVNNGQINNIGVPGIRVVDFMVPGYTALNPYAARFFTNATSPAWRPLDELGHRVRNQHPTFFTLWLGIDDVMDFALAGGQGNGTGNALPVAGNLYNTSDISNTNAFFAAYDSILQTTISTSASGALINVPDITTFPFFNVIPANGLRITTQGLKDTLNGLYPSTTPLPAFDTGYNFFVVRTHNGVARQALPGEKILMTVPMDSIICAGWGSIVPIPEKYVLTTEELQQIAAAIDKFNAFIQTKADLNHLAYVNMYSFLTSFPTGFAYNGIKYTTQYATGGTFSLDGIHPTQRGYALIANKIITTVNDHYQSTIPQTDVNRYRGITFP